MPRRIPIRKSTSPDVGRLSSGLARPGMDTRIWSSLAYAEDDSAALKDGVFVTVILLPTQERMTARVPAMYAGNGFGFYAKIYANDELVVEVPRGEPAEGPVVAHRLWNKRHAPPGQAQSNPEDVMLVVQQDKHLRLITSGTGKASVASDDTVTLIAPKVRLGAESAIEPLILGNTYQTAEVQFLTQLATAAGMISSAGAIMVMPIVGAIIAGPMLASAAGTILAACTAFSGAYSTYLSTVANTK